MTSTPVPTLTAYHVHLRAPSGQTRIIELMGHSPAHAISSAIELGGPGPLAAVTRCHRLGDW